MDWVDLNEYKSRWLAAENTILNRWLAVVNTTLNIRLE